MKNNIIYNIYLLFTLIIINTNLIHSKELRNKKKKTINNDLNEIQKLLISKLY